MHFLKRLIIHIIANAAAIVLASKLISGFIFRGDWLDLVIAAALLGLVNSFIRPILKLLSFPLVLLTLGLFSAIINIAMLFLVSYLLPTLVIQGLWAGLWGVIVISLVNHVILAIFHQEEK